MSGGGTCYNEPSPPHWLDRLRFDAGLALPSPEGRAALLASSALHFDCPPNPEPPEPTLEEMIVTHYTNMVISGGTGLFLVGQRGGKTDAMRRAMERMP